MSVALGLLCVVTGLGAGPTGEPDVEESKNTLLLSCFAAYRRVDSRFAQTDILVCPDGRHRAYAEARAVYTVVDGKATDEYGAGCVNSSKLYLSASEGSPFETLVDLEPTREGGTGNGIWPADWSPDSSFLLVLWQRFFYESKYGSHRIMILDASSTEFLRPDFDTALQRHMGKKCAVFSIPQGFTENNEIVVAAFPDDYDRENSCVQGNTFWSFDPWKLTLRSLPEGFQVQHYGKWEPHPSRQ